MNNATINSTLLKKKLKLLERKLPQAKFVRLHQFQNDNFTYTKTSGEHASMMMLFTLVAMVT